MTSAMQSRLGIFLLMAACVMGNVAAQKPSETVSDRKEVLGYKQSATELVGMEEHMSLAEVGSSAVETPLHRRRRRRRSKSKLPSTKVRVARLESLVKAHLKVFADVMKEVKALRAEIDELRAAPTPSPPAPGRDDPREEACEDKKEEDVCMYRSKSTPGDAPARGWCRGVVSSRGPMSKTLLCIKEDQVDNGEPSRRRRLRSPKDEACTGKTLNEMCKYGRHSGTCQVEDEDDPLTCLPVPSDPTPSPPGSRRRSVWPQKEVCKDKKENAFCKYSIKTDKRNSEIQHGRCQGPGDLMCLSFSDDFLACLDKKEKGVCEIKVGDQTARGWCKDTKQGPGGSKSLMCLPASDPPSPVPSDPREEACEDKKEEDVCMYRSKSTPGDAPARGWCRWQGSGMSKALLCIKEGQVDDGEPSRRRRLRSPKDEACTGKTLNQICQYGRHSGTCQVEDEDDPLACLPVPSAPTPSPPGSRRRSQFPQKEECEDKKENAFCKYSVEKDEHNSGNIQHGRCQGPGDLLCLPFSDDFLACLDKKEKGVCEIKVGDQTARGWCKDTKQGPGGSKSLMCLPASDPPPPVNPSPINTCSGKPLDYRCGVFLRNPADSDDGEWNVQLGFCKSDTYCKVDGGRQWEKTLCNGKKRYDACGKSSGKCILDGWGTGPDKMPFLVLRCHVASDSMDNNDDNNNDAGGRRRRRARRRRSAF